MDGREEKINASWESEGGNRFSETPYDAGAENVREMESEKGELGGGGGQRSDRHPHPELVTVLTKFSLV